MRPILKWMALIVMMVLSIGTATIAQASSAESLQAANQKTTPVTVSKYPSASSLPAQTPTTAIPKVSAMPTTNRLLVILVSFKDVAIKQSEASWNQKVLVRRVNQCDFIIHKRRMQKLISFPPAKRQELRTMA